MKVIYLSRKRLMLILAIAVLLIVAGIWIASTAGNGTGNTQSTMAGQEQAQRQLPIYCVDVPEKRVALTFDAAWGEEKTQELLELLDQYQVKATFFLIGYWVDQYPDNVRAIDQAGHEIGNHSSTHPYMTQLSQEEMAQEIESLNEKVKAITGKTPELFRAPYGDYNDQVVTTVRSEGLEMIQWNVDSLDWKGLTGDEILRRVKKYTKPGSIILFHNNSENLIDGLTQTLDYLTAEGYSFCMVSELIYTDNYTIRPDGTQTQS